jgi:branched-chain amino acid transport system ATP-binding protein
MLRVQNLRAGYGRVEVLSGVSLHVDPGEIVALIGANGAGKSTLMNAIAGVVPPWSGTIAFQKAPIARLPAERISSLGLVLVPEGRQIFAEMSVAENLLLGAYARLRSRERGSVDADREEVLGLFPILRSRREQAAGTLSGGEQQMLALGRALMGRPRLLMLDEPSIGLAPLVVRGIMDTVFSLRSRGTTVLLVEQNARAALSIADRGYVMEAGRIVLEGSAAELSDNRDVQRAYLGKEYRRIDE